jgi:DNA-binding NarL/FixJ family response regulator
VRLVLCDRHRLFTESLAHVLHTRGETVDLVAAPEEAVRLIGSLPVDACLMELDFGGDRVVAAIEAIHGLRPSTRVVILTAIDEPRLLTRVLAAGVTGILSKDQGLDHIFHVLPRLVAGASQGDRSSPAARARTPAPRAPGLAELTPREREVLNHLVMGEGTATLARRLGVTYATARTHIQNVLAKLGVHSRLEAVAAVYYTLNPTFTERTLPQPSAQHQERTEVLDEGMA